VCLAVPGRVVHVAVEGGFPVARVEFAGVSRRVSLATLPEAREGDWILAHAGFALRVLEADAAQEALRWLGAES
jgi:hydrogenase expression/formation protein HypC